jgi:hypothetical protein
VDCPVDQRSPPTDFAAKSGVLMVVGKKAKP